MLHHVSQTPCNRRYTYMTAYIMHRQGLIAYFFTKYLYCPPEIRILSCICTMFNIGGQGGEKRVHFTNPVFQSRSQQSSRYQPPGPLVEVSREQISLSIFFINRKLLPLMLPSSPAIAKLDRKGNYWFQMLQWVSTELRQTHKTVRNCYMVQNQSYLWQQRLVSSPHMENIVHLRNFHFKMVKHRSALFLLLPNVRLALMCCIQEITDKVDLEPDSLLYRRKENMSI